VQLAWVCRMTSTGCHKVMYTVAPFQETRCPLQNTSMRLYKFSVPTMLSSLRCAICLRFWHISAFTWQIFSCSVIVDLTCRKLSSDFSLVNKHKLSAHLGHSNSACLQKFTVISCPRHHKKRILVESKNKLIYTSIGSVFLLFGLASTHSGLFSL
jgi:hypothetical protein